MSNKLLHAIQHLGLHLAKEISKDPKKALAATAASLPVAAPYIIGTAVVAGVGYLGYLLFKD